MECFFLEGQNTSSQPDWEELWHLHHLAIKLLDYSIDQFSNMSTTELPLEFHTDSTSSTPNYHYHHNTQPPTYSPLLSSRRKDTFSTTKVIVQRPHSASSKSKSIRSSTVNTAAVKQSPVEELKNRLRIYSATTTAK
jgi:hypothetical protein